MCGIGCCSLHFACSRHDNLFAAYLIADIIIFGCALNI
jgi:hypothetical protein